MSDYSVSSSSKFSEGCCSFICVIGFVAWLFCWFARPQSYTETFTVSELTITNVPRDYLLENRISNYTSNNNLWNTANVTDSDVSVKVTLLVKKNGYGKTHSVYDYCLTTSCVNYYNVSELELGFHHITPNEFDDEYIVTPLDVNVDNMGGWFAGRMFLYPFLVILGIAVLALICKGIYNNWFCGVAEEACKCCYDCCGNPIIYIYNKFIDGGYVIYEFITSPCTTQVTDASTECSDDLEQQTQQSTRESTSVVTPRKQLSYNSSVVPTVQTMQVTPVEKTPVVDPKTTKFVKAIVAFFNIGILSKSTMKDSNFNAVSPQPVFEKPKTQSPSPPAELTAVVVEE